MINFKLPLSLLLLLAAVSLSACSSNSDSSPAIEQTERFEKSPEQIEPDTSIDTISVDTLLSDDNTSGDIEFLRVKHHQVECEGYQVGHCLLTQQQGSDDWTFFYDQIEGFEYEWGNDYEILVYVQEVKSGISDMSSQAYSLVEVISTTKADLTESFQYTSHNLTDRISEVAPGRFSLLGNKEFTCKNDSCSNIRAAIAQSHSALLTFQHATNPNEPLVLEAVLCSDSKPSFAASCL